MMGMAKSLLMLVIVLAIIAIAGYYALKSYVLPGVLSQINTTQLQNLTSSFQITPQQDFNPFGNASSGLLAPP